jgi:adenosylcobinamide kinase / adenosylcobinamide-phosphate guanylyltransferase
MKTLLLGGVRSGKSRYAAELARELALPVTLIATGAALDEEMEKRIEAHRGSRPADWMVVEEPTRLAAALSRAASPHRIIIVDCLTLWLTNLLCSNDAHALHRESNSLLETLPTLPGHCVMVANEVGLGIIPVNDLARRFTDEAGALHQALAARCERVILMVAGLPVTVKAPAVTTIRPQGRS